MKRKKLLVRLKSEEVKEDKDEKFFKELLKTKEEESTRTMTFF
jgi:ribosomal protein L15E|tara:strand:+ start:1808 stop:1936 length:129 start_codon:yes stop_codon:yes gene_type:complete